jgi:uncharacterized repeat protein (TIGR04076 family)
MIAGSKVNELTMYRARWGSIQLFSKSRGLKMIKITVVRCFSKKEIFEQVPNELEFIPSPCGIHKEGQEFIVDGERPPEGFCGWAFNDIYRDIIHLQRGGNYPWAEQGVSYNSCTDGRKTVVFKIERL